MKGTLILKSEDPDVILLLFYEPRESPCFRKKGGKMPTALFRQELEVAHVLCLAAIMFSRSTLSNGYILVILH